jgi:hypothetical protein
MSFHDFFIFRVYVEVSAVVLMDFSIICDLSFSLLQLSLFFLCSLYWMFSLWYVCSDSFLVLMIWSSVSSLYLDNLILGGMGKVATIIFMDYYKYTFSLYLFSFFFTQFVGLVFSWCHRYLTCYIHI